MPEMKQLYGLLASILQLFDSLLETEEKKLVAIATNDMEGLDELMKEEQAFTLRLRGFDQKREAAQKDLGFEGLTLKEIMEKVGPEDKQQLEYVYAQLTEKTETLHMAMDSTQKLIERHMQSIDALMAQKQKGDALGYDNTREKTAEPDRPRFTQEDI